MASLLSCIFGRLKTKDTADDTPKILCQLNMLPQVRRTDTAGRRYITQQCFTDLLEICHHLGVLYIFLKPLKIYGGDLNAFRTICSTLLNNEERGKIAILRNLEQRLWRSQRPENVLRLETHTKEKERERERRRVAGNGKVWDPCPPGPMPLVQSAPTCSEPHKSSSHLILSITYWLIPPWGSRV